VRYVAQAEKGLRGVTLLHSLVSLVEVDHGTGCWFGLVFNSFFGTGRAAAVVLEVII
jgi:hypothetical protein